MSALPLRVWLVDDDASIRWVLERALRSDGILPQVFDAAEPVLAALGSDAPDVLITDVRMAGRSGIELLKRVHATHPALPVIVMTAHSDLGTALLAQNEIPRAVRELERAIALDPARATFRSNLGYALQIEGKLADAIAQYRESIRLDPKLASAWINLATALARDPKTRKEARAALEKAKALDPTDPRVKANLDELDALEKGAP